MKKIYYITAVFATLFLVGCGDGIDLPGVNVETDLNKIPLPDNNVNLEQVELKPSTEPMLHEGLHTEEDFQRIRDKKAAGEEPWISAYQLLVESQFSQKTADTYPTEWIKRGVSGDENYMNAARGATIAYQQALLICHFYILLITAFTQTLESSRVVIDHQFQAGIICSGNIRPHSMRSDTDKI